ncbi:hypothetical protein [Mucilaginibacter gotjawali]|uniref:Outer membrane protein beta-barrel domain-containing protein n=1 Tax=Mucilaginibacter gotjawali TaxID=1550579 RepID=A0A839S998_9SPHI|nr:hypothetical protein [Mucilaginibacter gotjawali]MBB3054565.1 hypothetical protein [Mucilaginibacter gotjawali]
MKKLLKCFLLLCLAIFSLSAFGQSNKIGFKYYLTKSKVDQMTLPSNGFGLKDSVVVFAKGETVTLQSGKTVKLTKDSVLIKDVTLCNGSTLQCNITPTAGFLQIDPWAIVTNPCGDPSGKSTMINAFSKNSIIITFPRKLVGNPTMVLNLNYGAWILNVSTLGVKFRPSVKDSNNVKHAATATGSNLNLGLTYGYSWGFTAFNNRTNNSYSFTLSGGLGFSTIDITKEIVTAHLDSGLGSEFVLSPSINMIFARNDIGILFALGTDLMTGKQGSSWAYHGKPYFGLGIAAGFRL